MQKGAISQLEKIGRKKCKGDGTTRTLEHKTENQQEIKKEKKQNALIKKAKSLDRKEKAGKK